MTRIITLRTVLKVKCDDHKHLGNFSCWTLSRPVRRKNCVIYKHLYRRTVSKKVDNHFYLPKAENKVLAEKISVHTVNQHSDWQLQYQPCPGKKLSVRSSRVSRPRHRRLSNEQDDNWTIDVSKIHEIILDLAKFCSLRDEDIRMRTLGRRQPIRLHILLSIINIHVQRSTKRI